MTGVDFLGTQKDFYESALEQVERNFCDFNTDSIMITAPSSTANMFFEKKSFFYWLDDGIVEISLESSKKGKWKTMDDNLSAEGNSNFF